MLREQLEKRGKITALRLEKERQERIEKLVVLNNFLNLFTCFFSIPLPAISISLDGDLER